MLKLTVFIFLALLFQAPSAFGQACGKSVRTIELKFPVGVKPARKVAYELFYLAPKNTGADYNDYERTAKFLSKFLYDEPEKDSSRFWFGYDDAFVTVPANKAENYLKTYRLEDFRDFYTNKWHDNHLSQLKGAFQKGFLKLETRETDITPFIMRVTAAGFETSYLLSSFLGGCFNNQPRQFIQLKKIKK